MTDRAHMDHLSREYAGQVVVVLVPEFLKASQVRDIYNLTRHDLKAHEVPTYEVGPQKRLYSRRDLDRLMRRLRVA